jgi:hypothetical protein
MLCTQANEYPCKCTCPCTYTCMCALHPNMWVMLMCVLLDLSKYLCNATVICVYVERKLIVSFVYEQELPFIGAHQKRLPGMHPDPSFSLQVIISSRELPLSFLLFYCSYIFLTLSKSK